MKWLEQIQQFLNRLDQRKFLRYSGVGIVILLLLSLSFTWFYHRRINILKNQLEELNIYRTQAQRILTRVQEVQQEEKRVKEILAEDENFKIEGYFEDLLADLGLTHKRTSIESTTQTDLEGAYDEATLRAKLDSITMKDLTELLQKIEQTKRIFTKELDITQAKKGRAIDVTLTIATLLPKEVGVTR